MTKKVSEDVELSSENYVSRGTFLNTTGLAFSLGIAIAYLVSGGSILQSCF